MKTNEITVDILINQSFDSQKFQLVLAFIKSGLFHYNDKISENFEMRQKGMILLSFGIPRLGTTL